MSKLEVSLDHARLVIGLQGQHLGLARTAELDPDTGVVVQLNLETRWQRIAIPWRRVAFLPDRDVFQLTRSGGSGQPYSP